MMLPVESNCYNNYTVSCVGSFMHVALSFAETLEHLRASQKPHPRCNTGFRSGSDCCSTPLPPSQSIVHIRLLTIPHSCIDKIIERLLLSYSTLTGLYSFIVLPQVLMQFGACPETQTPTAGRLATRTTFDNYCCCECGLSVKVDDSDAC